MTKTNIKLVNYVISKLGSPYVYGFSGIVVNETLIQAKAKQYPNIYTTTYIKKARKYIGEVAYDCSGLIDSFLGVDKSANGYYDFATIKGNIGTMPKEKGVFVHMDGHIGVYIGDGYVVEARGIDYGVVKTKLSERPWQRWSKCQLITFISPVATRPVNPYSVPLVTLYKGNTLMTKTNVKWLQFELNWRYGSVVVVDGLFGKITNQYLGVFQKNAGLVVDYRCGKLTKAKLITDVK